MRVVAGTLRGRSIVAPDGDSTRPTTDRTREAVFNALASLDVVEDAVVVDLFAGSGAMGIEALSRGARRCTFIERDRRALDAIRTNVTKLGVSDRANVVAGDVFANVVAQRLADLVIADPPYDFEQWSDLLRVVTPALAPGGLVVAESGREIEVPDGWEVRRARKYGRTWVAFLERSGPSTATVGS